MLVKILNWKKPSCSIIGCCRECRCALVLETRVTWSISIYLITGLMLEIKHYCVLAGLGTEEGKWIECDIKYFAPHILYWVLFLAPPTRVRDNFILRRGHKFFFKFFECYWQFHTFRHSSATISSEDKYCLALYC